MESILQLEQIEFYQENGFIKLEQVLSEQEIRELTSAMDEVMTAPSAQSIQTHGKRDLYYRVLNQRVNTWRDHGVMARYTMHPKLAQIAMELSGAPGIRVFHDHALWKMPQDSKETPWHQDFPYWPMVHPGALSVWIPMQDVDESNGCMMFVPGSHKVGKLKGINLVDPENIYDFVKGTEIEKTRPVKVPLKAGDITFHSGLTFHYAHANLSDQPRKVLAIIYMPDGTQFDGKSHICTNGMQLQKNQLLEGGLFPLAAQK